MADEANSIFTEKATKCRPSGTMHRKVSLDAGWQKEAFGAMLGHLDTGEVVALIPASLVVPSPYGMNIKEESPCEKSGSPPP